MYAYSILPFYSAISSSIKPSHQMVVTVKFAFVCACAALTPRAEQTRIEALDTIT